MGLAQCVFLPRLTPAWDGGGGLPRALITSGCKMHVLVFLQKLPGPPVLKTPLTKLELRRPEGSGARNPGKDDVVTLSP